MMARSPYTHNGLLHSVRSYAGHVVPPSSPVVPGGSAQRRHSATGKPGPRRRPPSTPPGDLAHTAPVGAEFLPASPAVSGEAGDNVPVPAWASPIAVSPDPGGGAEASATPELLLDGESFGPRHQHRSAPRPRKTRPGTAPHRPKPTKSSSAAVLAMNPLAARTHRRPKSSSVRRRPAARSPQQRPFDMTSRLMQPMPLVSRRVRTKSPLQLSPTVRIFMLCAFDVCSSLCAAELTRPQCDGRFFTGA